MDSTQKNPVLLSPEQVLSHSKSGPNRGIWKGKNKHKESRRMREKKQGEKEEEEKQKEDEKETKMEGL